MPLELVYPADLLEGVMKQVKPTVVLTQVCMCVVVVVVDVVPPLCMV